MQYQGVFQTVCVGNGKIKAFISFSQLNIGNLGGKVKNWHCVLFSSSGGRVTVFLNIRH